MTDLSSIVASERTIDIKHPATDEPVGLRITLYPDSHPVVQAAQRKALNERMQDTKAKITAEKIEAQRIDRAISHISAWDWQGELTFHGDKPDLSPENVRKVMTELSWVLEQVEGGIVERAAFFRGTEG